MADGDREISDETARRFLRAALDYAADADDPIHSAPSIDGYLIQAPIGRGGGGRVYRAVEVRTHEACAIKILHGSADASESFARFRQEARVLSLLSHQGFVRVRATGTVPDGGRLAAYMVMDLVAGPDLGEWSASPQRTFEDRIDMMARIAEIVDHAHRAGVIHRDLKPSNVRIRADGSPVVLDFGVAHVVDADARTTGLETATGRILGTPAYIAPEQIGAGTDRVDIRFDVYALGVMTFEILAGTLPIRVEGLPLLKAIEMIRSVRPPLLSTIDVAWRGDIEAVVDTALAKDMDRRYRTAGAFAADLRRVVAAEPVSVRVPGIGAEMLRLAKAHRGAATAATAALVMIIAALFIALAARDRAREAERRALNGWNRWIDFADGLQKVDVSSDTRRAFASFIADWSESIDPMLENDGERRDLMARTLDVMSDIEHAAGERDRAMQHRLRVLDAMRAAAGEHPDEPERMRSLSRAITKVGDLKKETRDLAAAAALYEESFLIEAALHRRFPRHAGYFDDYVWALLRRFDLRVFSDGIYDQALLAEYLRECRALVALDPERSASQYALAEALVISADPNVRGGRDLGAIDGIVDEAREIARRLVERDPSSADYRALERRVLVCRARSESRTGRASAMESTIDEAAAIAVHGIVRRPDSAAAWADVAELERILADSLRRAGPEARGRYLAHLRALVALDAEIVRRDPRPPANRDLLIRDASELADQLRAEGTPADRAVSIARVLEAAEQAENPDALDAVSRLFVARAMASAEAGPARDVRRARMLAEAAAQILERSSRLTPETLGIWADVLDNAGDPDAAARIRARAVR